MLGGIDQSVSRVFDRRTAREPGYSGKERQTVLGNEHLDELSLGELRASCCRTKAFSALIPRSPRRTEFCLRK